MDVRKYLNGSGMLKVSGEHSLYWEDWGNPKAKVPIFFLHGGPGSAIKNKDELLLDYRKQRAIFFDQRGAEKSDSFASTDGKTFVVNNLN